MIAAVTDWLDRNKKAFLLTLCCIQLTALAYDVRFCDLHGYLPPPFFYNKHDSLMDLFHPAFWSIRDGVYNIWNSVYPPLNFVVLKAVRLFSDGGRDFANAFALRAESGNLIALFIAVSIFAPFFVVSHPYWKKFSTTDKILICILCITSAPFLFMLERGNLLIFSFFLLPFLFSSARARIISIALLINLKPYFLVLLLKYIFQKNWKDLQCCLLLTGSVYLFTCILMNCSPLAMPINLLNAAHDYHLVSLKEVMAMPSSISALSYVLGSETFQQSRWALGGAEYFADIIEAVKWGFIFYMAGTLWKVKRTIPTDILFTVLLVVIPNLGISVGGYTLNLFFVALPVFAFMRLRAIYFTLVVLIALPLDTLPVAHDAAMTQMSYISGQTIEVPWSLGIGSFIRPLASLLIMATMAWDLGGGRYVRDGQHVAELKTDNLVAE